MAASSPPPPGPEKGTYRSGQHTWSHRLTAIWTGWTRTLPNAASCTRGLIRARFYWHVLNWHATRLPTAQLISPHSPSTTKSTMSLEDTSRFKYQSIFDSALEGYKRKTRKDLTKDPLLRSLEACNSPDAVLTLLRAQILAPGQSQSSSDKLTTWLDPAVNVINAFSATIGGGVGLVSLMKIEVINPDLPADSYLEAYPPAGVIFTGIGVLLSVRIHIDSFPRVIVIS